MNANDGDLAAQERLRETTRGTEVSRLESMQVARALAYSKRGEEAWYRTSPASDCSLAVISPAQSTTLKRGEKSEDHKWYTTPTLQTLCLQVRPIHSQKRCCPMAVQIVDSWCRNEEGHYTRDTTSARSGWMECC